MVGAFLFYYGAVKNSVGDDHDITTLDFYSLAVSRKIKVTLKELVYLRAVMVRVDLVLGIGCLTVRAAFYKGKMPCLIFDRLSLHFISILSPLSTAQLGGVSTKGLKPILVISRYLGRKMQ